jgi:hypothetical protein
MIRPATTPSAIQTKKPTMNVMQAPDKTARAAYLDR